ncbi:MAG: hypothetical protein HC938_10725 [Nitrospira sp.]|nr:hypothetical protein [Nitrospira sp.]
MIGRGAALAGVQPADLGGYFKYHWFYPTQIAVKIDDQWGIGRSSCSPFPGWNCGETPLHRVRSIADTYALRV